jgi:hypothetical protein
VARRGTAHPVLRLVAAANFLQLLHLLRIQPVQRRYLALGPGVCERCECTSFDMRQSVVCVCVGVCVCVCVYARTRVCISACIRMVCMHMPVKCTLPQMDCLKTGHQQQVRRRSTWTSQSAAPFKDAEQPLHTLHLLIG